MRARIAAKNFRGTATSAIWKITYPECVTTLAPILISFSRSVVNDQCFTGEGAAVIAPGCENFDTDSDGNLDLYDFATLRLSGPRP